MYKSGWVSLRTHVCSTTCEHVCMCLLQGQYIKSVFEDGTAELAGMLSRDHVLEVDGIDVTEMSHMKVS